MKAMSRNLASLIWHPDKVSKNRAQDRTSPELNLVLLKLVVSGAIVIFMQDTATCLKS